ncbi:MAG: hypothetical protein ACRDO7_00960, partial [Nocardioidaceae bacterium]
AVLAVGLAARYPTQRALTGVLRTFAAGTCHRWATAIDIGREGDGQRRVDYAMYAAVRSVGGTGDGQVP